MIYEIIDDDSEQNQNEKINPKKPPAIPQPVQGLQSDTEENKDEVDAEKSKAVQRALEKERNELHQTEEALKEKQSLIKETE